MPFKVLFRKIIFKKFQKKELIKILSTNQVLIKFRTLSEYFVNTLRVLESKRVIDKNKKIYITLIYKQLKFPFLSLNIIS